MSERRQVMEYLRKRIINAWNANEMVEAQDCLHFRNALELMTDEEYDQYYADAVTVSDDV